MILLKQLGTLDSIFKDTKQQTVDGIARFLSAVSQMAACNAFTLADVSRYVKRDGVSGYEYCDALEGKKFIPETKADLDDKVSANTSAILLSVRGEIERFTIPCAIDKVPVLNEQPSHQASES